ncbi:related to GAS1 - glycophospholipid-anchored surface glycoprotein [Melanopsichium pennsylvanicum]|uniref:1,3-beta-glucanosyltransferase n=2 Tax=Melanopsichium pennsylvanicum TaxID=63383 RepID=A0AAJ4XJG0_9BASI|nr:related to GAS1-glycophospholipid-anchored surface glycoprotein [Melanopsichium pennsylvanicum 4]SNX83253.1 related to GAS1 - glycophospholipid-anchored surface glycoprotein [Melanopsichium pennsylvanicum]
MVRGTLLPLRSLPLPLVLILLALVAFFAGPTEAIPAVTRRGKYLYQGNDRFYIKGVAYQEAAPIAESTAANDENGGFPEPDSFTDPLALPDACNRDVANFRELGVNTIRVYSVNSSLDHDACMSTFSNAGIYVILDLALPLNGSINRAQPSWDVGLLNLYANTIDTFTRYDNLLAVNIANEVVTQPSNAVAAPFIKAAVRDVKAYLASKNSNVLVSYSSTDGPSGVNQWRDMLAYYLTCGSAATSVDLYGLNSYSWCGDSSFTASGYSTLTTDFNALPVAAYLAEFGCVDGVGTNKRPWTEVAALYSRPMTDTFSGGVAFSYFPQSSGLDYGLVSVSGDTVTTRSDWDTLKRELANTRSAPASAPSDVNGSPNYQQCRGGTTNFPASTTLPPTPSAQLCNCIESNAFSCILNQPAFNSPSIIGTLTGQACVYLSEQGGSCDAINADGESGTYGDYSFCTSSQRLEWAMSEYYEMTGFNVQSCDFAGNASVQDPPGSSLNAINEAFTTCLQQNPIGVITQQPDLSVNNSSRSSAISWSTSPSATQTSLGNVNSARPSAMGTIWFMTIMYALIALTVVDFASSSF